MTKEKPIYVLDHKLKWSVFKMLQDKLTKDSGPSPVGIDKMLWGLLREKKICCWFSEDKPNDMGLGLELPKDREYQLITNPKKMNKKDELINLIKL